MSKAGFEDAYKRTLVYEGGKVDDPHDPGGRTNKGITQRVYDAWRHRQGKPTRDVYDIAAAEVKAIYRHQYWDAVRGDDLPVGVDMFVYDGAVNSGPLQSIKWLQAGLGVDTDGHLGTITLEALKGDGDNDLLIERMAGRRMAFLRRLKTWRYYGKGWSARVANLTKAAEQVALGSIGPAPVAVSLMGGHQKAMPEDVPEARGASATGQAVTGAGVTLETANEMVKGAADQVQAVSDVSEVLRWLFIVLTIVGLGLTVYAFWRSSQSRKAHTASDTAEIPWNADEGLQEAA